MLLLRPWSLARRMALAWPLRPVQRSRGQHCCWVSMQDCRGSLLSLTVSQRLGPWKSQLEQWAGTHEFQSLMLRHVAVWPFQGAQSRILWGLHCMYTTPGCWFPGRVLWIKLLPPSRGNSEIRGSHPHLNLPKSPPSSGWSKWAQRLWDRCRGKGHVLSFLGCPNWHWHSQVCPQQGFSCPVSGTNRMRPSLVQKQRSL